MFRGHLAPVYLGFETQDNSTITYGHVHIPSISLKEIPVQREQLRLRLSYGEYFCFVYMKQFRLLIFCAVQGGKKNYNFQRRSCRQASYTIELLACKWKSIFCHLNSINLVYLVKNKYLI